MKTMIKRLLTWALCLCMASVFAPAARAESVTVKNYQALVTAVNEEGVRDILIAAKYKHGTKAADETLTVGEGETLIIRAEEGAVVNGTLNIDGPGSVTMDGVTIISEDAQGLSVSGGAVVIAGQVSCAKGKKGNTAVQAVGEGTSVTVESAMGGDCTTGIGGCGALAYNGAVIHVGNVRGGSSTKGYGGCGAMAESGGSVEIIGDAVGVDGPLGAGRGVLASFSSKIEVDGSIQDGLQPEEGKAEQSNEILTEDELVYRTYCGETNLVLSRKFKVDDEELFHVFAQSEAPIMLTVAEGKENLKLAKKLLVLEGSLVVTDIDFSNVLLYNAANLNLTGSLALPKWEGSDEDTRVVALVRDQAVLTMKGDISAAGTTGKNSYGSSAIYAMDHSVVTVEGAVSSGDGMTSAGRAITASENAQVTVTGEVRGGESKGKNNEGTVRARDQAVVTVYGNVTGGKCKGYVYKDEGGTELSSSNSVLYTSESAVITVYGDVRCGDSKTGFGDKAATAKNDGTIHITGNAIVGSSEWAGAGANTKGEGKASVTIDGNLAVRFTSERVGDDSVAISGNVTVGGIIVNLID